MYFWSDLMKDLQCKLLYLKIIKQTDSFKRKHSFWGYHPLPGMWHWNRTSTAQCLWAKEKGVLWEWQELVGCLRDLGVKITLFVYLWNPAEVLMLDLDCSLGQRMPELISAAGLALNSRFWVPGALISSHKWMPMLFSGHSHCSWWTLPLQALLRLSLEKDNDYTGREERREVQLMPQYLWPKLSFLQVAWLSYESGVHSSWRQTSKKVLCSSLP